MRKKVLLIGGGISNASLARLFLNQGFKVEIREKTNQLGGMLADKYDKISRAYISWTGPHIINFSKETREAEEFLKKHTALYPFVHKVLCIGNGSFTFWPINQSYQELFEFLNPDKNMFEEFIVSYSKKMWGKNYQNLIKNLKERFEPKRSRSNLFFEGKSQYQPERGYTNMIKDLVRGARVICNREENISTLKPELNNWDYVIVSGPIDSFFRYCYGTLEFAGLDFIFKIIETDGDSLLPTPVVNLNAHPKFIRVSELNQLQASENRSKRRVLCFDIPSKKNRFYPLTDEKNLKLFKRYLNLSKQYNNLFFHGRLGQYKYLDIDDCIKSSMILFEKLIKKQF